MNNAINAVCAGLAVFAMGYVLVNLAPLFGYAVFFVGLGYGYAYIRRKVLA